MVDLFEKYKIEANEQMIKKLYDFADYLTSENQKYNLTAIRGLNDMIIKHFIDSAVILNYVNFPENASVIDIGAGAGFPSVPISILREDLIITCLDSSAKKINFIKNTAELLNLQNLDFYCGSGKLAQYIQLRDRAGNSKIIMPARF